MGGGRRVRQYLVGDEFARGGIATVHLAKHLGDRGFARVVAVKMLHPRFASSSYYTRALEQEARLAARIRHAHVVQSLDVVADGDDLLLVMEYVDGVSLATLLTEARRRNEPLPAGVTASIVHDALLGLDAAHEARDERGRALSIVHRDVSPQNILVGADGIAKLTDFGIAKAMHDEAFTASGGVIGKLAYMAPEQRRGLAVGRQTDLFAAAVVLAEALTGKSSPTEEDAALAWRQEVAGELAPRALGELFRMATRSAWVERYASAGEMAVELARILLPASKAEVRRVLVKLAGDLLEIRAEQLAEIEALKLDAPDAPREEPRREEPRKERAAPPLQTETQPLVVTAPMPSAPRAVLAPAPRAAPATAPLPPALPARRVGAVAMGAGALVLASVGLAAVAFLRGGASAPRDPAPHEAVSASESVAASSSEVPAPPPSSAERLDPAPVASSAAARTGTRPKTIPPMAEKRRPMPSGHPAPSAAPPTAPSTFSLPPLDPSGTRL